MRGSKTLGVEILVTNDTRDCDPPRVTEDPADVTEDPPGVAEDTPSTVAEDGPGVSEGSSLATASLTPPALL